MNTLSFFNKVHYFNTYIIHPALIEYNEKTIKIYFSREYVSMYTPAHIRQYSRSYNYFLVLHSQYSGPGIANIIYYSTKIKEK